MSLTREQMLAEMGIAPIWRLRDAPPAAETLPGADGLARAAGDRLPQLDRAGDGVAVAVDAMDWRELGAAVSGCRACPLGLTLFDLKPGLALSLSLMGYTVNLAWSAIGGIVYLLIPERHEIAAVRSGSPPA